MALHLKATGIEFADFAGQSTTSELFDDYEEGGWNAYWTGGGNNSATNPQVFAKIGRLVHVEMNISANWNASPACTGDAVLKGLPYNSSTSVTMGSFRQRYVSLPTGAYDLAVFHPQGGDTCTFTWMKSGAGNSNLQFSELAAWGAYDCYFGGAYMTAT